MIDISISHSNEYCNIIYLSLANSVRAYNKRGTTVESIYDLMDRFYNLLFKSSFWVLDMFLIYYYLDSNIAIIIIWLNLGLYSLFLIPISYFHRDITSLKRKCRCWLNNNIINYQMMIFWFPFSKKYSLSIHSSWYLYRNKRTNWISNLIENSFY